MGSTRCQTRTPFVELQKAFREVSILCKYHLHCLCLQEIGPDIYIFLFSTRSPCFQRVSGIAWWSYQVFKWDNSGSKKASVFNLRRGEVASFLCMIYSDHNSFESYVTSQLELITPFTDDCWQFPYLWQELESARFKSESAPVPVSFCGLWVTGTQCHREWFFPFAFPF